jgi:hypothetical protein
MISLYGRIRSGFESLSQYRTLKRKMFSGNPLIVEIGRREAHGRVSLSLLYRNGLVLTLGEEGILDFQDKDFSHYLGGASDRAVMENLHKLVLKSLIRYMVHASAPADQRERAAEAASKLYLAEVEATTDWLPGPAAAVVHGSHGSFKEESFIRP